MKKDFIKITDLPNLTRGQVRENFKKYVNPGYCTYLGLIDLDKIYVRAEGVYAWDGDGNRYIDCLGGFGVLALGHNHPRVLEAIRQVSTMPNLLQVSLWVTASALAHNIAQITPGDLNNTFFCNSGAEAVEGAIKLARIATGRQRIISCQSGFHGKTMGSLSVSGRESYQKDFHPLLPACQTVGYGDLSQLEEELKKKDVAAFVVEPIQGEAGVILPPEGYLKEAMALCRRYGTLFVADEVQTGFGRTGKMFAVEHDGLEPDILCLAKALGGGVMPFGAVVTTEALWNKAYGGIERCRLHTSTFGGNTWAAAAGIATLEVIVEEDLSARAAELGEYFITELRNLQERYSLIREVRGRGLLIGIEFEPLTQGVLAKVAGSVNKLAANYIGAMVVGEMTNQYRIITAYTLNNPNVVRLEPPLIITKEQIDVVLEALEATFTKNSSHFGLAVSSGKTLISGMINRRKK